MPPALNIKRECHCKRVKHRHGTYQAYQRDRCRCPDCRRAWTRARTRYEAGLTAQAIDGQRYLVDRVATARYLGGLYAAGFDPDDVARETGIAVATIHDIVQHGTRKKKVSRPTAEGIVRMARRHGVKPTKEPATSNTLVPAVGSQRRVQGLIAVGWPTRTIAELAGVKQPVVGNIAREMTECVTSSTHAGIIKAAATLLKSTAPEGHDRMMALRYADRRGFLPYGAWDSDEDMDDPEALPLPTRYWHGRVDIYGELAPAVADRMKEATRERARRAWLKHKEEAA